MGRLFYTPQGFEDLDVGGRVRVELIGTDAERGFIDFALNILLQIM
jgi:hypothetical protein